MSLSGKRKREWLSKKKRQGFRGYPIATLSLYGPDDKIATKLAIGVVSSENDEATIIERLHSSHEQEDIRSDETLEKVAAILQDSGAKSVVMADRIIGCPHEEGIDYPDEESCPQCPFWRNRDRWTGEVVH